MMDYNAISLGSMMLLFIFWGVVFLVVMGGVGLFLIKKQRLFREQSTSAFMPDLERSDYLYRNENQDHYQHMWRTIRH